VIKIKDKFYITTPIYYPSATFHIGHCYTTIIADSIAKYNRLNGKDVFFLTGADEHGQKIQKKAIENGVSPKEYVDKIVANSIDLWEKLGISYDKFIRTTDEYHEKAVQKIFLKLYEQGDIYKGEYIGKYCTPCESFWTDSQLDENGNCPDCHREVHEEHEEAYFLKISKYKDRLEKYYEEHPDFIEPLSRKNEMVNNFLSKGLDDLCVSRTSFDWGVKVPFDEKHVVYVWLDALTNYITALGYLSDDDSLFKKFWPADLHLVGKEIIRFHVIIWPIILMALDLPLPKKVFGHGWLLIEGNKVSKSSNNYSDPREYIKKYGVDAVRYFVLREVSLGNDGNFSVDLLIDRANSDLANIYGNLVNRTCKMVEKYFDGIIPESKIENEIDKTLIKNSIELKNNVDEKMNIYKTDEALSLIFDLLKSANKYIDDNEPWVLAKDEHNKERLGTVLYNLLEVIRISSILLKAFIPTTSNLALNILNTKYINFEDTLTFGLLESGTKLNEIMPIFNRIEKQE
jgi:methionyl-tRNA synthetase